MATWLDDVLGYRSVRANDGAAAKRRGKLRVVGTGVTVEDDPSLGETVVTLPEAGDSAAVISRTRFVDQLTSVASEDQTGSVSAPFSTLAAAVASLLEREAGETSPTYHYSLAVFPGNYSAEDPVSWDTAAYGISLTISAAVPGTYEAGQVVLPELTARATAGSLTLSGVYALNGISGGWNGVRADRCKLGGVMALGSSVLDATDCWLDQPTLTCGGLRVVGGLVEATDHAINCSFTSVTLFEAFGSSIGTLVFTGSAGVLTTDAVSNAGLGGITITNGSKTVLS